MLKRFHVILLIRVDIIGNFFSRLLKHFFGYHWTMESSWNSLVSTIALFLALHIEFVFEIIQTHVCKTVVGSISMAFILINIAIVSEKVKFWWFFLVFLFRLSMKINYWALFSMEINNWFWFTMEINLWNRFLDRSYFLFLFLNKFALNRVLSL